MQPFAVGYANRAGHETHLAHYQFYGRTALSEAVREVAISPDAHGRIRGQGHDLAVGEFQYHFPIAAGAEDRVRFEYIPGLCAQRFSACSLFGNQARN